MTWFKNKTFYLFVVLLTHVSLLDLFFVTNKGPVFLVDKNLEIKTIITHLIIIFVSVGFYILLNAGMNSYQKTNTKVSDFTWVIWSVILILAIGFILI